MAPMRIVLLGAWACSTAEWSFERWRVELTEPYCAYDQTCAFPDYPDYSYCVSVWERWGEQTAPYVEDGSFTCAVDEQATKECVRALRREHCGDGTHYPEPCVVMISCEWRE